MSERPKVNLRRSMSKKDDIRLTLHNIVIGDTSKFGYTVKTAYEFWQPDPNDVNSPQPKGIWVLGMEFLVKDKETEDYVKDRIRQEEKNKLAWLSIEDARKLYEWMIEDGWEDWTGKKVFDKNIKNDMINKLSKNIAKEIDDDIMNKINTASNIVYKNTKTKGLKNANFPTLSGFRPIRKKSRQNEIRETKS